MKPFRCAFKAWGAAAVGGPHLKKRFYIYIYIYKIIIEFGSKISPGRASTSLPSHGAHSVAAAARLPRAEGRVRPTGARGPVGTRPWGHCAYTRNSVPACGGTGVGCPEDSAQLYFHHSVSVHLPRVESGLERPPPCCSVSRRRVEVSLSLSLHSHGGGAFFPTPYSGPT